MQIDTAVVLAAGEGTRLRPLTSNRPKPMLPAAGRPILEHVLDTLVDVGIERLVLVVGYSRQRVQGHFGHSYRDVPITYARQGKQLGSGHALKQAEISVDPPLLVVNGDRVLEERIVADTLEAFDGTPTLAVIEHANPSEYGAATIEGDRLVELVEKPDTDGVGLINAGVYAFDESVFDAADRTELRDGELQLPDIVATLMTERSVRAVRTDGLWVDATYPWDLLYLTRELLSHGRVPYPEQYPGVWIADGAQIHESAALQAPAVVGPDAVVAAGAVVGSDTVVGRNTTVGANATVVSSLIDDDGRIGAGATLVDCVAGTDVSIGTGTVVSGGAADIAVDDRVFQDQRLGAAIADRASIGGGSAIAPGALVGAGATVGHGVRLEGRIPDGAEVVR